MQAYTPTTRLSCISSISIISMTSSVSIPASVQGTSNIQNRFLVPTVTNIHEGPPNPFLQGRSFVIF